MFIFKVLQTFLMHAVKSQTVMDAVTGAKKEGFLKLVAASRYRFASLDDADTFCEMRRQAISSLCETCTYTNLDSITQCFSTFLRPRPGKFFFQKTRALSQQIYS